MKSKREKKKKLPFLPRSCYTCIFWEEQSDANYAGWCKKYSMIRVAEQICSKHTC